MLVDHVEDLLSKATSIDVVVFQRDRDKALVVNDTTDELFQTLVQIVEG